jgi:hypothetical protein
MKNVTMLRIGQHWYQCFCREIFNPSTFRIEIIWNLEHFDANYIQRDSERTDSNITLKRGKLLLFSFFELLCSTHIL